MPRLIDAASEEQCVLEECIEGLAATGFDPQCEERIASASIWLRKLNNNRTFLGDLLIEQIKPHYRDSVIESGYGPQAIVLGPKCNDVFLRANIWPAKSDHCFQASGAQTFVYGVPHDHNFSFLTCGYLGPGYRSDYYEYDYESVAGFAGERPKLRFVGRGQLDQGRLMLYRAHVDIHNQIPPESLSVSLNAMHVDPAQHWYDQYGFDLEQGAITRVLNPNSTEAFLRVAVASGHQGALDLAEQFGRHHPSDRLRLASYEARAGLHTDLLAQDELWREAELSGCRMLRETARQRRTAIAACACIPACEPPHRPI